MIRKCTVVLSSLLMLGSCSVYHTNVTTDNSSRHVEGDKTMTYTNTESTSSHQSPQPFTAQAATRPVTCIGVPMGKIDKPSFNEAEILSAKNEREMIRSLLAHISTMEESIAKANERIDKYNKSISRTCK